MSKHEVMLRLPPLNALKVFESVARLGSVKLAAEELCVTPPAVSHQIGNLESFLGEKLFQKQGKRLILNEIGEAYVTEIRPCLGSISRATKVASFRKFRETLTISAPPSLIGTWLIPRLQNFLRENRHLDLRFIDRMTVSKEDSDIDLAIEYRYERNPDFYSEAIMSDDLVVLVSPDFQEKHKLTGLHDLQGIPLIETERRLTSWKTVLNAYKWADKQQLIRVSYSLHAFEAAMKGLGVAIGNRENANTFLEQGRLIIPFSVETNRYAEEPKYFLTTKFINESDKVLSFRKWIIDQIRFVPDFRAEFEK